MRSFYFTTNIRSPIEAESEVEGIKVAVKLESDSLVVENVGRDDKEEALKKAKEVANTFLSTLSLKFGVDMEISDGYRTEFAREKNEKVIIAVVPTEKVKFRDEYVVTKKDQSGNIIAVYDSKKPGPIKCIQSEAASYYRRGRLSSDPFDQFRNFYLVAENIADRIRISKGLGIQKEQPLLEIALRECFGSNTKPLENVARSIPGFNLCTDVISEVASLLYKGHRCQLNHSKALEDKKIPFDYEDEKEVKQALPLMEFVAKSLLQYEDQNL